MLQGILEWNIKLGTLILNSEYAALLPETSVGVSITTVNCNLICVINANLLFDVIQLKAQISLINL